MIRASPVDSINRHGTDTHFLVLVELQHSKLDSAFSHLVGDCCLMFGHSSSLPHTSEIPGACMG